MTDAESFEAAQPSTGASESRWNFNDYHWEERDFHSWAQERLRAMLVGAEVWKGKEEGDALCATSVELRATQHGRRRVNIPGGTAAAADDDYMRGSAVSSRSRPPGALGVVSWLGHTWLCHRTCRLISNNAFGASVGS